MSQTSDSGSAMWMLLGAANGFASPSLHATTPNGFAQVTRYQMLERCPKFKVIRVANSAADALLSDVHSLCQSAPHSTHCFASFVRSCLPQCGQSEASDSPNSRCGPSRCTYHDFAQASEQFSSCMLERVGPWLGETELGVYLRRTCAKRRMRS